MVTGCGSSYVHKVFIITQQRPDRGARVNRGFSTPRSKYNIQC